MTKEIFLIRHGETDFNKQGIIQGRSINSSLNLKGRAQAQQFFNQYKDEGFEVVITSAMKRTHETVEPFINAGIPWEQHPELDEINWGLHEGQQTNELMLREYNRIIEQWRLNRLDEKPEGGESALDLQNRQKQFLRHLIKMPYQKILICSHGRAIRSLICTMTNHDLCRMDDFPHSNVALYRLRYENGQFQIVQFNNTDHLKEE